MVVVAAVVAAAEVVAAVVAAVVAEADLTAHLGGTTDRLTVNWHWRFIGLLCLPSAKPRQRQRPSAKL